MFYKIYVNIFIFLVLIIACLSLSSDFFLDIPGISINALISHACALERLPGVDIGGKATCWGEHQYDNLLPIQNVIIDCDYCFCYYYYYYISKLIDIHKSLINYHIFSTFLFFSI